MPGEATKLQQAELRLFLTSRCCTFPHFMAPFRCHQACPSTGPRFQPGEVGSCGAGSSVRGHVQLPSELPITD